MLSFFFSSRRRHTRCSRDWSSDVCSSDLQAPSSTFLPCILGALCPIAPTGLAASCGVGTSRLQRSEEHTSELQSRLHLVCRLLLEKKKTLILAMPANSSTSTHCSIHDTSI